MPSSYNITDIAYSEALSGTLPIVAASARPVSLNRVLRSDLGWIDTLHVIYIIYLYIFVVLMEADTFVWDFDLTNTLCHLEVLKNHYVTIRKAMKSEKAGRSGSETRESTKSPSLPGNWRIFWTEATIPITVRQLEAIVRIAESHLVASKTASAKLRSSKSQLEVWPRWSWKRTVWEILCASYTIFSEVYEWLHIFMFIYKFT